VGQNYYVYLDPKSNKFQFMPWDLDHSFGQFGMQGSQEQREQLSINHPWRGDIRFLERIYKVDAFKKLYLAKMEEFSKTIFVPARFHQQVDHLAAAIRPAVADESKEMLARFDKVVSGQSVEPMMGMGGPGGRGEGRPGEARPGGAQERGGEARGGDRPRIAMRGGFGAKPIKGFVDARAKSVAEQLAGKSQGMDLGGGGFGGGRRGGGPGGPGGGPGAMLGQVFMNVLDGDKNGALTSDEMAKGFDTWFATWNSDKSGLLTEEQLRDGLNQLLMGTRQRGNERGGGFRGGIGGPPRDR
jgi:hypothetical protein